jgi:hypothetical protein
MSKGSDDKAPLFLSTRLLGINPGDSFRPSSSFAGVTDLSDSLGLCRRKLSTDDLSASAVETSNEHEVGRRKINALAERGAFHKSNEGGTNLVVDIVGKLKSLIGMSSDLFAASYATKVFGSMVQFSRP